MARSFTYKSLISKAVCKSRSEKYFIIVTLEIRGSYILRTHISTFYLLFIRECRNIKKAILKELRRLMLERVKYIVWNYLYKIWCYLSSGDTTLYKNAIKWTLNEKHILYKNLSQEIHLLYISINNCICRSSTQSADD